VPNPPLQATAKSGPRLSGNSFGGAATVTKFGVILSLVLIALAGYVAVMNWAYVFISLGNRRVGIDKHHSTVPVASWALAFAASKIYPFPPTGWFDAIPLADIGNWMLK
jgi:hypothetical protein